MNMVMLIGNLGADPEGKALTSGARVVNLRIATSESWKDKTTGEKKEKTEWHRITIWNEGLGGIAEKYLHKGDKIMVQGQLQTRKWKDKDDKDCYSTEVVLQGFNAKLLMLSTKGGDKSEGGGERLQAVPEGKEPASRRLPAGRRDDIDDEIPF